MPRYARERDDDFRYEIVDRLGVVGKYQTGWSKEINMVSWHGASPKLDIRDWDPKHERMSRGVTMHKDEVLETIRIFLKFYGNDLRKSGEEQPHRPETHAAPAGSHIPIHEAASSAEESAGNYPEAANMMGEPEAAAEGLF